MCGLVSCSVSEGCRNLEYLNLSWCDQITKDGIEALVRGCRGLKALLLRGCTQVPRGYLRCVSLTWSVDTSVENLLLHFSWFSTIPSPGSIPVLFSLSTQLEDEALKHIQNYCHELVSLNFQSCSVSSLLFLRAPSCPTFLESPVVPLWSPQAGGMVATPFFLILYPHTICWLATRWKNNSLNTVADTKPFTFPTKNNIDWHLGLF